MAAAALQQRMRNDDAGASSVNIVRMAGITKAYGPTLANNGIDLTVPKGGVVGLVGGNGAGKSTLMKALCGAVRPDAGTLSIDAQDLDLGRYDAATAQAHGIRIVHQELSLCSNLTVAENFFLEAPAAGRPVPGWRGTYRDKAKAALDTVFPQSGIDVEETVDQLSIGQRQMVEIARAAAAPGLKLLILDEPTSSLDLERSRQLRAYIHAKTREDLAFIFISHKLAEIMDVATRIVVLRNGALAWVGGTDIAPQKLVEAMGGEAEAALRSQHTRATLHRNKVLTVGGDVVAPLGRELEFWTGEIVGLAGLEGSGQKTFLHRVFAASDRPDPEVRLTHSASFVSGDRQREGAFPFWSVFQNMDIARVARRFAFMPFADETDDGAIRDAAQRLRLDEGRLHSGLLDLSGGNQQKALVARALITDAPTILLDDPMRGVDVGAKADFYRALAISASVGRLILWHSTEDIEFLECDRVLIFSRGRIIREFQREEISEQAIVDASFAEMTAAKAGQADAAGSGKKARHSAMAVRMAPFLSLIAAFAVLGVINPTAASPFGLDLLLGPAIALVLVALGQMFAVGGSEIDLGIGAFAGLISVVGATTLVERPWLGVLGLLAAFAAYAGLGAIIQLRKIPAIVVTLGASFIWAGIGFTLQPTPEAAAPSG